MAVAYRSSANGSSSGTTLQIGTPSGCQVGDVLLFFAWTNGNYTLVTGGPSGWTQLSVDGYGGMIGQWIWYKIANSADASGQVYTVNVSSGSWVRGVIGCYSGCSQYAPIDPVGGNDYYWYKGGPDVSISDIIWPSWTPSVSPDLLVLACAAVASDFSDFYNTPPSGATQRAKSGSGTTFGYYLSDVGISSGAWGSRQIDFSLMQGFESAKVALKAAQNPTQSGLSKTSADTVNTPTFQTNIADWDTGQQIKARFSIYQSDGTTLIGTIDSSYVSAPSLNANVAVSATYGSALAVGQYKVSAQAIDSDGLTSAQSAQISFQVVVSVNKDSSLLWNVASPLVGVTKDSILKWNVAELYNKRISLVWNVMLGVNVDSNLLWRVKTPWSKVIEDTGTVWVGVDES